MGKLDEALIKKMFLQVDKHFYQTLARPAPVKRFASF